MTKSNTARKVTRPARDGYNEATGVRRTTVVKGDRTDKKVHLPQITDLIVEITLPAKFAKRDTKGGRGGGIPYEEYQQPCSGTTGKEFIKMNSFVGPEAAGTTIVAKVKIGLQNVNQDGTAISNYYIKVEDANGAAPTHTLQIDLNGLAVEDTQEAEGIKVIDLSDANPNVYGGFIVTKL